MMVLPTANPQLKSRVATFYFQLAFEQLAFLTWFRPTASQQPADDGAWLEEDLHAIHEATVTKRTSVGLGHHVSKPTTITSLSPLPYPLEQSPPLPVKTLPNSPTASHSCQPCPLCQGGTSRPLGPSCNPCLSEQIEQHSAQNLPIEDPTSIGDTYHSMVDMGKHTLGTLQLQGQGNAANGRDVSPSVIDPGRSTMSKGGNGECTPGHVDVQVEAAPGDVAECHMGPKHVSHEAPSESSGGHASLPPKQEERKWAGTRRPVTRANVQRGSRLLPNRSLTGGGVQVVAPALRMSRETITAGSLYGGTASSVVESDFESVRETALFGGFSVRDECTRRTSVCSFGIASSLFSVPKEVFMLLDKCTLGQAIWKGPNEVEQQRLHWLGGRLTKPDYKGYFPQISMRDPANQLCWWALHGEAPNQQCTSVPQFGSSNKVVYQASGHIKCRTSLTRSIGSVSNTHTLK